MRQDAQQGQVHLWTDSITVNGDPALTQFGQRPIHLGRVDDVGNTHAITDIKDRTSTVSVERACGRNQGGRNVSGTHWGTPIECGERFSHGSAGGRHEFLRQVTDLNIHRHQTDSVFRRQCREKRTENGKGLNAMFTRLTRRSVDKDNVIQCRFGRRQMCGFQHHGEVAFAVWSDVLRNGSWERFVGHRSHAWQNGEHAGQQDRPQNTTVKTWREGHLVTLQYWERSRPIGKNCDIQFADLGRRDRRHRYSTMSLGKHCRNFAGNFPNSPDSRVFRSCWQAADLWLPRVLWRFAEL